ncbi:helix-turn-helix domain-containing protein [Candidatus Poriferisocius sp.]|uniref:helix-turn-helix domain-containing protein n=1 Tax=Candidatus Poriferisocius sp. TaxID=3101276 RepID=UPI003B014DC3
MSDSDNAIWVPIRTAEEMGRFIRSSREGAQMTQAALAGRLGVSRKWVSEVEQGKQSAEVGKVLAALLHLGFTPMATRTPPPAFDVDALLGSLTGE